MFACYVNDKKKEKKKSIRDPNDWAENWEMVFDTAACRTPWTPDLLMVVSVSDRRAACGPNGRRGKRRGIQSLPFNQCPLAARRSGNGNAGRRKNRIGSAGEPGGRWAATRAVRGPGGRLGRQQKGEAGTRGLLLRDGCNFAKGRGTERRFAWWLRSQRAAAAAAARSH